MDPNDLTSDSALECSEAPPIVERQLTYGREDTVGYLLACAARREAVDGPLGNTPMVAAGRGMAQQPKLGLTA